MKLLIFHIIIFCIGVVNAQDVFTPNVQILEYPNPCGGFEDRRVTLLVDIGKVEPSHQLYGFEFGIEYDSNVMVFDNLIRTNTMLEYLGENISIQSSDDLLTGGGALLTGGPIYGDRPLFAVSFRYLEGVFDSTEIKIRYLYMLEEFNGEIDLTQNVNSINYKIDSNTLSNINLNVSETLTFNEDLTDTLNLNINKSELKGVEFLSIKIDNDDNLFSLVDVFSNTDFEIHDNKIQLYNIKSDENLVLQLIFNQKTDDLASNLTLQIEDVNISSCKDKGGIKSVYLKPYEKSTTNVFHKKSDNLFEIFNSNLINKTSVKIEIYNLYGEKIYEGNSNQIHLPSGLLFVRYKENTEYNILKIIN